MQCAVGGFRDSRRLRRLEEGDLQKLGTATNSHSKRIKKLL